MCSYVCRILSMGGGGIFYHPPKKSKQLFTHVTGENFEYVRWDNVGGGILPPPPLHYATGCSGPWIFMLVIYCFSSTSVFSSHCEQLLFTDFFHCNYTEKWLMWVIIRIFILKKSLLLSSRWLSRLHCLEKTNGLILYVQEVVTQPKILNRTILYNLVHVT